MSSRWLPAVACAVASLLFAACGGGDDDEPTAAGQSSPTTVATTAPRATTTSTTLIEGVQAFSIDAGHSDAPVFYPQTPPVGGIHNPVWQRCGFYDQPIQIEKGVHSLEHGAIWITYQPDLPVADVETLTTLARSRKDVLVSRWDSDLPSPIVATGWGRQLRLPSVSDPRLMQFVRLYVNQGPELNAPC